MKAAVVVFPGSNCDRDASWAFEAATGVRAPLVWHEDVPGRKADLWILPGGFAHGDYLRAGALAALSPAMASLRRHVDEGGLLLGICNGFQVLVEAGLLPGAFQPNASLHFVAKDVRLKVSSRRSPFLADFAPGEVIDLPIAHGEGNVRLGEGEATSLLERGQVAFRYVDGEGRLDPSANPNGSTLAVAGLLDETGRILGMMPHPERNAEPVFGTAEGARIFRSAVRAVKGVAR